MKRAKCLWVIRVVCVAWASIVAAPAVLADEPPQQTLRFGTIAPDGTAWARESRAFGREVETATNGRVHIKWYFGAIAGDEVTELERLRRGQLDGVAGSVYCEKLSPSLRALEVVGMVGSSADAARLLRDLQPRVQEEVAASPFRILFASTGFGHRVLFSRKPVRSMADLRSGRWWVWELDEVLKKQLPSMGVPLVPLPLEAALRAYEENRVDGFIVIPSAALAFQYSTVAKYFTDLNTGFLPGCLVMTKSALDQLEQGEQRQLISAAAKLKVHFEDVSSEMDHQLLGKLFERQGLTPIAMSPAFREELSQTGRAAYRRLKNELVPSEAARRALEAAAQPDKPSL